MKIKNSSQSHKTKLKHSPDQIIKSKSKNNKTKFNPLQYLNALIQLTNQNTTIKCVKKPKQPNPKRDLSSALTSLTPIYDKTIQSSIRLRCKSSLSQNKKKSNNNIKGLKNIQKINLENVITQEKDNHIVFTQIQTQIQIHNHDKYSKYYQIKNKNMLKDKEKSNNNKNNQFNNNTKFTDQNNMNINKYNYVDNSIKNVDYNHFAIKIQRAWKSYQTYKMVHKYYKYFKRIKKNSNLQQIQQKHNHIKYQQYQQKHNHIKNKQQKINSHDNDHYNNDYLNSLKNYYCQMPLTNDIKYKQNQDESNQIFNKTLKIKIKSQKNKDNQNQKNKIKQKQQNFSLQQQQDLNLTQKLHEIQQYVQRSSLQLQNNQKNNNQSIQQTKTIQIKKKTIPSIQIKKKTIPSIQIKKKTIPSIYNNIKNIYINDENINKNININQIIQIKQNCGQNYSNILLNSNTKQNQNFATIIQQQTQRYDEILNLIEHCSMKNMSQQEVFMSLLSKFQKNKNILEKDFTKLTRKNQGKKQSQVINNCVVDIDKNNSDMQKLNNLEDIIKLTFSPISPPSKPVKDNKQVLFNSNDNNITKQKQQDSIRQEQVIQIKSILKPKQQKEQICQQKYKSLQNLIKSEKLKQQNEQGQKQRILLNNSNISSKMIQFDSKQIIHIDDLDSGNSDIKLLNNQNSNIIINKNINSNEKKQQQYYQFNINSNEEIEKLSSKIFSSIQSEQNLLQNDSSMKKIIQFSYKLQKQSLRLNQLISSQQNKLRFSQQKLLSSTKNKQFDDNDNQFYAQIQKVNINDFYNSDQDLSDKTSIYSFNQNQYENQQIYKLFQKRLENLQNKKKEQLYKLSQYLYEQQLQQQKCIDKLKQIQGRFIKEKIKIQQNKKKYFQALKNVKKQALHFQKSMISLSTKKEQKSQKKSLLVRKSFSAQSIVIKCILAEPSLNQFNIKDSISVIKQINNFKKINIIEPSSQQKYYQNSSQQQQNQQQSQQSQIQIQIQKSQTSRIQIYQQQDKNKDTLQQQLRKCSQQIQKIIQQQLIKQIIQQIYLCQPILKSFKPFIEQVFEFSPIVDNTVKTFLKQLHKYYPTQQQLLIKLNQKINPNSLEILRLIRDYDFQIDQYDLILQEDVFKSARKSIQEEYKYKVKQRKNKPMVPNTDVQNLNVISKMYQRQQQKLTKLQKYLNYERDLKIMYLKSVFNCLNQFLIQQKSKSTHMYTRSTIGTGQLTLSIKQFNKPCDQNDLTQFFTSSYKRISNILNKKCMLPSFKNHKEIQLFQKQMLRIIKSQLEENQYKWVNYMDEVIEIWSQISNIIIEQIIKQTTIDIIKIIKM